MDVNQRDRMGTMGNAGIDEKIYSNPVHKAMKAMKIYGITNCVEAAEN